MPFQRLHCEPPQRHRHAPSATPPHANSFTVPRNIRTASADHLCPKAPHLLAAGHPRMSLHPPSAEYHTALPPQIIPTHHAPSQLRHPPHQTIHPQTEIGHRHPNPSPPATPPAPPPPAETRHPRPPPPAAHPAPQPPVPAPPASPGQSFPIMGDAHNLKPVQPHQFLLRPLRPRRLRTCVIGSSAPPNRRLLPHRMASYPLHPPELTRKQAHQQVRLMEGPRPQHDRLAHAHRDPALFHLLPSKLPKMMVRMQVSPPHPVLEAASRPNIACSASGSPPAATKLLQRSGHRPA